MEDKIKLNAYAKINAALDIKGKRDDGYHELKTVFCEIALHDVLTFAKTDKQEIKIKCTDASIPTGKENLVYKAADLLLKKHCVNGGIEVFIEKNIPSGAGLGGGSSDAAAALKAVNVLFDLGIDASGLEAYGAEIGADVPFFISGGMAYACGIGEKLTSVSGAKLPVLIVAKPDSSVSTVQAYKAADAEESLYHPDVERLVMELKAGNFRGICEFVGNSFEAPVFKMCPEIKAIKEEFLRSGAGASAMTGSGSAVFAFFEDDKSAVKAARKIKDRFAGTAVFLNNGERL